MTEVPLPEAHASDRRVVPRGWESHSVDYQGFGNPNFGGNVTNFAPHKALKSAAWRQVHF